MAEGGNDYDPCECVFSHEGAMRRLINMLRDSQNVCNDRECFTQNPGLQEPNSGNNISLMFMFFGWIVLVLVLFLMRPNSLRRPGRSNKRPQSDNNDEHNFEPPGIH